MGEIKNPKGYVYFETLHGLVSHILNHEGIEKLMELIENALRKELLVIINVLPAVVEVRVEFLDEGVLTIVYRDYDGAKLVIGLNESRDKPGPIEYQDDVITRVLPSLILEDKENPEIAYYLDKPVRIVYEYRERGW